MKKYLFNKMSLTTTKNEIIYDVSHSKNYQLKH